MVLQKTKPQIMLDAYTFQNIYLFPNGKLGKNNTRYFRLYNLPKQIKKTKIIFYNDLNIRRRKVKH